mgnify:CR=1 FL=1
MSASGNVPVRRTGQRPVRAICARLPHQRVAPATHVEGWQVRTTYALRAHGPTSFALARPYSKHHTWNRGEDE